MAIKLKGLGPLSLQTLGTINISLQMQGEEFYTSGGKWVFYITGWKLFTLHLQIK